MGPLRSSQRTELPEVLERNDSAFHSEANIHAGRVSTSNPSGADNTWGERSEFSLWGRSGLGNEVTKRTARQYQERSPRTLD